MSEIKVSVIMPVYNAETYLEEAIECLICQTLKEIEIIHQRNLYAGVARNNGLKQANGEFVIFLDSDDLFERGLLEKTYKQGKKVNADIVLFGGECFNVDNGEHKERPDFLRKEYIGDKSVFSRKDIPEKIFNITTPCPWTKLYSRKFIEREKLQFQELQHTNDAFFVLLSLALANKITYIDEVLISYRIGQKNNLQSVKSKNPEMFFEAYEQVFDALNEKGIYEEVKKSFIEVTLAGCVYNINSVKTKEAKVKIYQEMQQEHFTRMNLLEQEETFYSNLEHLYQCKGTKYILECIEKRNRNYEENKLTLLLKNEEKNIPKVSVVIPVYNTENYLKECLNSIMNQTLDEIEIICINDGSKVTRNRGAELANGKYIYFMDSDDILDKNALYKLFFRAEKDSLDMICFDGRSFVDDDLEGTVSAAIDYYIRSAKYNGVYTGVELLSLMQKNGDYRTSVPLQMVKKSFLEENNIHFVNGILHEDNLYTYQCMIMAKRVVHMPNQFFNRRYRSNSIMTTRTTFEHSYGLFSCYIYMVLFLNDKFIN